MDFFSSLERSLENLIEGTLLDTFKGRLQPIEVARQLWSEMVNKKKVSINDTYAPNLFAIHLSLVDYESLRNVLPDIEAEIIRYLYRESENRDFKLKGPIVLDWIADREIAEGRIRINSGYAGYTELEPDLQQKADRVEEILSESPGTGQPFSGRSENRNYLLVVDGFQRGAFFELGQDECVIGRDDSCDFTISDPRVSRRHVLISRSGDSYYVEDLNSRNGTFIDGVKITREILNPGCEITIGSSKLKYYRERL